MDYNSTSTSFTNSSNASSPSVKCEAYTTLDSNIAISYIIIMFLVVGSFGNITTVLVIVKNKSLHSPSNFFLFSLCISDLISGLICSPLWLFRRTWGFCYWKWGDGLCTFYWFADFATNYATAMHILSFALLRFFAVHWPSKITSITKKRVVIYICILWTIAVVISMPLFWLMGVVKNRRLYAYGAYWPSCSVCNNENIHERNCITRYNVYTTVVSFVFIWIPQIGVIALSCCIAHVLIRRRRWRKNASMLSLASDKNSGSHQLSIDDISNGELDKKTKNNESEPKVNNNTQSFRFSHYVGPGQMGTGVDLQPKAKHAVAKRIKIENYVFTQLGLIILTFFIGYSPTTIYLIWTSYATTTLNGQADYWFGVISYLCLRLSECMNPVMYNLGSSKIRKATKELFKKSSL